MSGCSHRGATALAAVLLVLAGQAARASDIETRDFIVLIAGKPAGEVHMTIHRQDNGSVAMRCDTDINVHNTVGTYKFIYRGLEVWHERRLVRFDSNTDDNGKRYIVSAAASPEGLRLRVNNVERIVRPEVWLTSYWSLPDSKVRAGLIPMLDADNGRDLEGKLTYIATEKKQLAGQEVTLNHYRLSGKVNVELWYDGSERLVRQEWSEQGHKAVLELTRVRR